MWVEGLGLLASGSDATNSHVEAYIIPGWMILLAVIGLIGLVCWILFRLQSQWRRAAGA